MRCYPDSHAAALVWYCGMPEWEHMRFTIDFLRPGDWFVDVGANVGSYSMLAAGVPDVHVVAFEPSTQACGRLRENVEMNRLGSRVDVRQVAVGAGAGSVVLTVGRDAINRVVAIGEAGASENVDMTSLDAALGGVVPEQIRLIKIDVEGYEDEVLRGTSRLLATAGPVLIVEANDPAAARDILQPLGYGAYRYNPPRRQIEPIDWLDVRDNNLLLVRDRAIVDQRLGSGPPSPRSREPG